MDKQLERLQLESQHNDRSPLLKDPTSSSNFEQILSIQPSSTITSTLTNEVVIQDSNAPTIQNEVNFSEPCYNILTTQDIPSRVFPTTSSFEEHPSSNASTSSSRPWTFNTDEYDQRQPTTIFNSGLWISIEFIITSSQIIASIVVLSLSNLDNLLSLFSIWIIGYAIGCFATLPILYWRYKHRYLLSRDEDVLAPPQVLQPIPTTTIESNSNTSQEEILRNQTQTQWIINESRLQLFVEKFKIGLDCFFAMWFVVGNVWVFGPHSSSRDEPTLYKFCVVLLSFSCIAYAMPFVLCTTICCCLPCIVAFLGFHEEPHRNRGASSEIIETLPTYQFQSNTSNSEDVNRTNNELNDEGDIVGQGTINEKFVSKDDALCSICLGKYKDKVELRELPCSHHFHVECVDRWLKINALCPLCKCDLSSASESSSLYDTKPHQLHEQLLTDD